MGTRTKAEAVGSDFDGSINPFPGILTAESFYPLSKELIVLAGNFLEKKSLSLPVNLQITAEEIIGLFLYDNLHIFLKNNYA